VLFRSQTHDQTHVHRLLVFMPPFNQLSSLTRFLSQSPPPPNLTLNPVLNASHQAQKPSLVPHAWQHETVLPAAHQQTSPTTLRGESMIHHKLPQSPPRQQLVWMQDYSASGAGIATFSIFRTTLTATGASGLVVTVSWSFVG
jgi:hypothetical protein